MQTTAYWIEIVCWRSRFSDARWCVEREVTWPIERSGLVITYGVDLFWLVDRWRLVFEGCGGRTTSKLVTVDVWCMFDNFYYYFFLPKGGLAPSFGYLIRPPVQTQKGFLPPEFRYIARFDLDDLFSDTSLRFWHQKMIEKFTNAVRNYFFHIQVETANRIQLSFPLFESSLFGTYFFRS